MCTYLPEQVIAIVLWIAHTWIFRQFEMTPYLAALSAEKRSGKTLLMDILAFLVAQVWQAISPSEAVLYRKISQDKPTLLLDEVDTIFNAKSGGACNRFERYEYRFSAWRKVPRCVGDSKNMGVAEFDVYCRAFAGIGTLPDTVGTYSIVISMQRCAPSERPQRFRHREASEAAAPLRSALLQWSETLRPV